eukprot:GHVS01005026.1.p1 GENE.GHVS01005026.1~~GHVS01005026.1.p1  ORF type:complete len:201 (-),score=38.52 GHVS01005026.1:244-846(-)
MMDGFRQAASSSHLCTLRALVVGATVGGLAAARSLQRVGYDVCVVDRFPSLLQRLRVDRGIVLHQKAREVFGYLGLSEELRKHSCLVPFCTYTDLKGVTACGPSASCSHLVASVRQSVLISQLLDDSLHPDPLHVLFNTQLGYINNNTSTGLFGSSPLEIDLITTGCGGAETPTTTRVFADVAIAADGTHSLARRLNAAL